MKKKLFVFVFSMVSTWCSTQAQEAFQGKVIGKGDPVLLFPGFACTGEVFEETVKALSSSNECHVFTFAGFGGVPAIEMPWLPKIKDQVLAYVKSKKLNKPVIIGHSLGGTLGLWLASTDQSLFKKVIAVDALPCNGAVMMSNYDASSIVYESPYSKQMLQQDTASFRKQVQQQVGFMMLNKEKQTKVVDMMLQADRKTYVYGYVDLLKLDLRNDIAGIQIPVVLLAATHPNKAMIEKTYNEQYTKLGNKVIHYADKAAHFVMYDQLEWYINKIKENIQ
jgi:pimeloyl-ACP methyl ester carboxylesterase